MIVLDENDLSRWMKTPKSKFASHVGILSSPIVLSFHCQQISGHNTLMCVKREVEGEPESENARQFQDPHGTR